MHTPFVVAAFSDLIDRCHMDEKCMRHCRYVGEEWHKKTHAGTYSGKCHKGNCWPKSAR